MDPPPIVRQIGKNWTAERRLFITILIQSYARRLIARRQMRWMQENAAAELPELASDAEDELVFAPNSPREVWRLEI